MSYQWQSESQNSIEVLYRVFSGKEKDRYCRFVLIELTKPYVKKKVSCFGKKQMYYSYASQYTGSHYKKISSKSKTVRIGGSSISFILIIFNTYRFSFLITRRTFHKWQNIQRQRMWKLYSSLIVESNIFHLTKKFQSF